MATEIDPIDIGMGPVRAIPWEQFKAEVLAGWSPPAVSKAHGKHVERVCRAVEALDLAGEGGPPRAIATTADLTAGLVTRFMASMPPSYSPWTVKQNLVVLQTICGFAEKNRWLVISPFRLRQMSKWIRVGKPVHKRAATREEVRAVLDLMARDALERGGWAQWRARRLYALTALIAYTGLRWGEAIRLHVADLDLEAGMIELVPRGKGFKTTASAQPVPMPPALVPIVRDWLDHRLDRPKGYPMPPEEEIPWLFPTCNRKAPWTSGSPASKALARLKAAGKRAGVPDINFHMLRRSWATHAEFWGIGPSMIQRVLRHTHASTTEHHYRKADAKNMIDAVKDVQY